jgi:hypothetical protein
MRFYFFILKVNFFSYQEWMIFIFVNTSCKEILFVSNIKQTNKNKIE